MHAAKLNVVHYFKQRISALYSFIIRSQRKYSRGNIWRQSSCSGPRIHLRRTAAEVYTLQLHRVLISILSRDKKIVPNLPVTFNRRKITETDLPCALEDCSHYGGGEHLAYLFLDRVHMHWTEDRAADMFGQCSDRRRQKRLHVKKWAQITLKCTWLHYTFHANNIITLLITRKLIKLLIKINN